MTEKTYVALRDRTATGAALVLRRGSIKTTVKITARQFDLVAALASAWLSNGSDYLTTTDLQHAIGDIEPGQLPKHVFRLRRKLGRFNTAIEYTAPLGYRMRVDDLQGFEGVLDA